MLFRSLADGAVWIAELFADLGVHRHVLDVFHASQYLETLMVALAWSEEKRLEHRRAWLRGEVDGLAWLNWHVTKECCINFDELVHKALGYLNRQAFLGRLAYPTFKREGFEVIGSGQIEGANKRPCPSGAFYGQEERPRSSVACVWRDLERGWCGCKGVRSGLLVVGWWSSIRFV